MEIIKDKHIFNLKLTKKELAYLFKLIVGEYKYYIKFNHKNNYEKGHLLLGLIIKLKNKYWELG